MLYAVSRGHQCVSMVHALWCGKFLHQHILCLQLCQVSVLISHMPCNPRQKPSIIFMALYMLVSNLCKVWQRLFHCFQCFIPRLQLFRTCYAPLASPLFMHASSQDQHNCRSPQGMTFGPTMPISVLLMHAGHAPKRTRVTLQNSGF